MTSSRGADGARQGTRASKRQRRVLRAWPRPAGGRNRSLPAGESAAAIRSIGIGSMCLFEQRALHRTAMTSFPEGRSWAEDVHAVA
jgi:hypothetical protein